MAVTDRPTPLPVLKVFAVGAALFANQFSSMVVFPFLAFMTADFFPSLEPTQLGPYAGLLGSAFHLGGLAGSMLWGYLSDRYGRRPMLLAGIGATFFMIVMFGMSSSFAMAVFWRFLWGFLNGNVGIGKAYLSEICDETNQAKGYSVIGLFAGFGRLLGPGIGAYLSKPTQSFPDTFGDSKFLAKYPYFLPCAVAATVCVISFVMAYLYLEEAPSGKAKSSNPTSETSLLPTQSSTETQKPKAVLQLVTDSCAGIATALYGLLAFTNIMGQELFPLWTLTAVNIGGLNFTLRHIGLTVLCAAPVQILFQLFVFPALSARWGYKHLYQRSTALIAVVFAMVPQLHMLTSDGDVPVMHASKDAKAPGMADRSGSVELHVLIGAIVAFATVQSIGTLAFTSTFVLINNSVHRRDRGLQNGIGQTYASLARTLGPLAGGVLFAWSETNHSWPFDYHFAWYVTAMGAVACYALCRQLPKKVDTKMFD
eukprot:TRINITY_DN10796_c0_g1_i2.p1 TRINITY_DN10796_c0_g1~~TRINITY_DN10796_c0_g1_i2.p1  ORF type:complete len:482 (+),score=80.25 TRINITY_DN10796_c0_g1_i2:89-1534(+)